MHHLHPPAQHPKNKTTAAWLALLGGPLGLHRFYLFGPGDIWAWLHLPPTMAGAWGLQRLLKLGPNDPLLWWLLPWLGLVLAAAGLACVVYGLCPPERWNARHNPQYPDNHLAGHTHGVTVLAVVAALLVGSTGLMSSLAMGFQHYFEEQARSPTGTSDQP